MDTASRKKKSKEKGEKDTASQPNEVQNEDPAPGRPPIQVMSAAALTDEQHDEEAEATAVVTKVKTVSIKFSVFFPAIELTIANVSCLW